MNIVKELEILGTDPRHSALANAALQEIKTLRERLLERASPVFADRKLKPGEVRYDAGMLIFGPALKR